MSKKSDDKNKGQDVDLGRRNVAKAGLAAPVIMTLASRPVFGAQCLSQMMSGNMSHVGGGSCVKGWSPGAWSKLQGEINNNSVVSAWRHLAGSRYAENFPFRYAENFPLTSSFTDFDDVTYSPEDTEKGIDGYLLKSGGKTKKPRDYIGGTLVADLPPWLSYSGTGNPNPPIRLVLSNASGYKDENLRHCLTALMNARAVPGYILTEAQVKGLCEGSLPLPPGYDDLNDFFDSTWGTWG